MNKIVVSSSNIEAIGYDTSSKTLRVWFLNGTIYEYYNVDEEVFYAFLNASSHGSFLYQNIKGHFSYEKMS